MMAGSNTGLGRGLQVRDAAVRVPKTAEIIASSLRRQIVRGELPEGSMLPSESALVEQFGVSRPSVREALRVLESERLVEIQRGARGGGRVRKPEMGFAAAYLGRIMQFDGVTVADVWQARAVIEPIAVRLLAEREDRAPVVSALEVTLNLTVELETDVRAYALVSYKFHEQIVLSCGNQTLGIMWGCLKDALQGDTLDLALRDADLRRHQQRVAADRREVLRLIAAGEGVAAARFWSKQMGLVGKRLLERGNGRTTVVEVIE
jgi:DNA-binding FadR family transcriptional regulator